MKRSLPPALPLLFADRCCCGAGGGGGGGRRPGPARRSMDARGAQAPPVRIAALRPALVAALTARGSCAGRAGEVAAPLRAAPPGALPAQLRGFLPLGAPGGPRLLAAGRRPRRGHGGCRTGEGEARLPRLDGFAWLAGSPACRCCGRRAASPRRGRALSVPPGVCGAALRRQSCLRVGGHPPVPGVRAQNGEQDLQDLQWERGEATTLAP